MRIILTCLLLGLVCPLPAQRPVHHYPAGHSIGYGTVQAMAVSTDGYLWLGGQTSLRRYDGTEMELFGHRREDTTTLSNDYVRCLYEGPDRSFWIGHDRGISRFDFRRERFYNFTPPPALSGDQGRALSVYAIVATGEGQLWIGSGGGLHLFDPQLEKFIVDTTFQRTQLQQKLGTVTCFYPAPANGWWLAATGGLFHFLPATKSLRRVRSLPAGSVKKMGKLADGHLIVATNTHLYRLRPGGADEDPQVVREIVLPTAGDARSAVTDLLVIPEKTSVFVATTSGLLEVDWRSPAAPRLLHYSHNPEDDASLASQQVYSLARTPDNVLLVGTRRGVDRLSLEDSNINIIRRIPGEVELCSDITKGSALDSIHQVLLLGTQEGLSLIDLKTGSVRCYTPENLPGLRRRYIFNVDPGPRPHTFWIGYRQGGFNLLVLDDPEEPYFEEINSGAYDLSGAGVYEVVPDGKGNWWLATSDGLYRHHYATGTTTHFPADPNDSLALTTNNIFSVLHDRQDRLWVGTRNGGLCLRQIKDGETTFHCFRYAEDDARSLPSDMVLNLFEDRQGRIWISNPEALAVYLPDGSFRTFGLADDLPYALCYGVFDDAQGRLWVAFGGNFSRFELTEEGDFQLQQVITRNDGLAGQANAQYGWTRLTDGRFALSQRAGLNLFHPDSVANDAHFPPVLLTDFQLFNHSVSPATEPTEAVAPDFVLPHDINRLEEVRLPPHHDYIGLRFSGREFRPGHETSYSYRMAGIQDEWVDLEGRNFLSFPKLPPGDYRLELRTGDELVRWSEDVRTLDIHLAAPWYRRWWALFLFGLLGAGSVFLLGRERERQRQRVEAARVAERENFRRRSARDFHDEAGNHLSRVSLLTELARRQSSQVTQGARPQVQSLLDDINANVQVVREGMRDFIWALDPDNDNAYELGLRLKRFGQDLFTHHAADFSADVIPTFLQEIALRPDQRRHLVLLIKEAMHNSFKHGKGATRVHLALTADSRELRATWTDNGAGYDPQAQAEGTGLKNMKARAAKIEANLEVGGKGGSTVTVRLPL